MDATVPPSTAAPRVLPRSGSEPAYTPSLWNRPGSGNARSGPFPANNAVDNTKGGPSVQSTHNCYAYFLQALDPSRHAFPQPGGAAALRALYLQRGKLAPRSPSTYNAVAEHVVTHDNRLRAMIPDEPYTCADVARAVLADNPAVHLATRDTACPSGYYKGLLVVDPTPQDSDYHFYIQNAEGFWSHKPGEDDVTNRDAAGNILYDPSSAPRGGYTDTCTFFCVPVDGVALKYTAPRLSDGSAAH